MRITITEWVHKVLDSYISPGDICIDATMGKGNDTLFLCRKTGNEGKVIAFDIQEEALNLTKEKLKRNLVEARLIQDGHENMGNYAEPETVQCIMFNLGYLPGGDHSLATKAESSIQAFQEGFRLLKTGGIMSICIYSGGDSGFEERDQVLEFLKNLDDRQYFIVRQDFCNKSNCPPMPVFIIKL